MLQCLGQIVEVVGRAVVVVEVVVDLGLHYADRDGNRGGQKLDEFDWSEICIPPALGFRRFSVGLICDAVSCHKNLLQARILGGRCGKRKCVIKRATFESLPVRIIVDDRICNTWVLQVVSD
jgi:hypothetical protein